MAVIAPVFSLLPNAEPRDQRARKNIAVGCTAGFYLFAGLRGSIPIGDQVNRNLERWQSEEGFIVEGSGKKRL